MGPSLDTIRADEIRVGAVLVANTRSGRPFEPARAWSEVTATERVVAVELVTSSESAPMVEVVAVQPTGDDPQERITRRFAVDQVVQEVL